MIISFGPAAKFLAQPRLVSEVSMIRGHQADSEKMDHRRS